MPTFTYTADFGASQDSKPAVARIQFGDGYMARQAKGINTDLKTWSLRFSARSKEDKDAITAFLEARGGTESFDWTPPDEDAAIKVICSEWNWTIDRYNLYTIVATFEEVMEP